VFLLEVRLFDRWHQFLRIAFLNPEVFNLGSPGNIKIASLIEMSLGAAIGAITFTGSIIAF